MNINQLKSILGDTDMYLIDMVQKGYFDQPLHVLDAGCGSGRNISLLHLFGNKISAIDSSPNQINKVLNTYPDIDARVGEIGEMEFIGNTFDLVICNAVLHFAKNKQHFEDMLKDLVRVVKEGGHLFLRLVTSHTFNEGITNTNVITQIPDGSERFVVDYQWLNSELIPRLGLKLVEPFKTVNVDNKRTMTTLVLRAK